MHCSRYTDLTGTKKNMRGSCDIVFFFLSLAEARPDDPFHPAEQDKVHFGTSAFNSDRLDIAQVLGRGLEEGSM